MSNPVAEGRSASSPSVGPTSGRPGMGRRSGVPGPRLRERSRRRFRDDFLLSSSQPVTTVAAGCHLVFMAQPADAGKDKTITSVNLNDGGAPIALEVRDAGDAVVPVAANVSLGLLLNGVAAPGLTAGTPSLGSGTITLAPQVSIPTATRAYTLQVTPTDAAIAGVVSNAFQIWDAAKACAVDCTLSTGGTTNTFTVAPNTPESGAGIGATVNAVNLDCSPVEVRRLLPDPGDPDVRLDLHRRRLQDRDDPGRQGPPDDQAAAGQGAPLPGLLQRPDAVHHVLRPQGTAGPDRLGRHGSAVLHGPPSSVLLERPGQCRGTVPGPMRPQPAMELRRRDGQDPVESGGSVLSIAGRRASLQRWTPSAASGLQEHRPALGTGRRSTLPVSLDAPGPGPRSASRRVG